MGDRPLALAEAFGRYQPLVLRTAKRWGLTEAAAQDVASEVWLRIVREREEVQPGVLRHRVGWAFGDRWKQEAKQRRLEQKKWTDRTTDTEGEMRHDDEAGWLRRLMTGHLTVAQQTVVELRVWDGLSWEEVGAAVGCTGDTARKRYDAALDALRRAAGQ